MSMIIRWSLTDIQTDERLHIYGRTDGRTYMFEDNLT